ncbi:TonB-dependent receptor [Terrihabitans soli]|uniref:TonB-dependent receptor n=1 Tax=Terrihabitans soli TaxID=708113 RepID=A0A6S6QNU6_9HYPH|nr:TonB-dependent hemoglobin/transferrin/lactoferrin family receptor [Terrihabitans soli]BCJ92204.1 TonB-dependent receptor [Terrihabitans soli]
MYRFSLTSGVALAALIALHAAPASAQQQSTQGQNVELDTINVEGNAKAKGARQGDAQPTVATQAETVLTDRSDRAKLDSRNVNGPTDINRLTPGVSYSETTRSFNVRGLDRMRVSTTIDGIPLPYMDDGARGDGSPGAIGGASSVDFDTLSAVDVVKGSDSSVFGGGMLGGGVRFRTLEPEDILEDGKNFGGITKFAFDSRDESIRGEQALAGRVGNTFVLVQGGYRDGEETENQGNFLGGATSGYVGPNGGTSRTKKNPSEYDQENLLVKLRHYTGTGHMIGITGERFDREENITPLTQSISSYDSNTLNTVESNTRERVSLDYGYDGGGWLDQAEAKLFWQKQDLGDNFTAVRRTTPAGPYRRDNTRETEIFGFNGAALKNIDTDFALHSVSFGAQIYGSKSHQYSYGEDSCPAVPPTPFHNCNFLHSNQSDMPDTDGLIATAFVQDQMAFMNDTVRVTPGVSFNYYSYEPELTDAYAESPAFSANGLPDDSSDVGLSPKLRVEADAFQDVTLFAQYARGFRAPTVNELYLTYGGENTYLRIGNDELETETSHGFDVGMLVGDDIEGGSAKVFYNRYKNFIDDRAYGTPGPGGTVTYTPAETAYLNSLGYNPSDFPLGVTEYFNRANVEIYGAEFEAHRKWENGLFARGQLGAYVGTDIDTDIGLNSIPAAKAILGAGYEQETWGAELILTVAMSRGFTPTVPGGTIPKAGSDLETLASETNSYQLIDFTVWWSPAQLEGLTVRAGAFNLTDETYFEDALDLATTTRKDYFTQPGRNYRVSATYKF